MTQENGRRYSDNFVVSQRQIVVGAVICFLGGVVITKVLGALREQSSELAKVMAKLDNISSDVSDVRGMSYVSSITLSSVVYSGNKESQKFLRGGDDKYNYPKPQTEQFSDLDTKGVGLLLEEKHDQSKSNIYNYSTEQRKKIEELAVGVSKYTQIYPLSEDSIVANNHHCDRVCNRIRGDEDHVRSGGEEVLQLMPATEEGNPTVYLMCLTNHEQPLHTHPGPRSLEVTVPETGLTIILGDSNSEKNPDQTQDVLEIEVPPGTRLSVTMHKKNIPHAFNYNPLNSNPCATSTHSNDLGEVKEKSISSQGSQAMDSLTDFGVEPNVIGKIPLEQYLQITNNKNQDLTKSFTKSNLPLGDSSLSKSLAKPVSERAR